MAISIEDQELLDLFNKDINELEELLNLKEKYGIFRFFRKDFWKIIKKNPNRLSW